jgi:hypothetical protein
MSNTSSRRQLLAGGAAVAGAAYVAPQVLRRSVAGAQSVTCYAAKVEVPGNCEGEADLNDSGCDVPFNASLAAAGAGATVVDGCGELVVGQASEGVITVTVLGCNAPDIRFVGAKFGNDCYAGSGSPPAAVGAITVGANGFSATRGQGTGNGLSHAVVLWCCPQGSM